MTQLGFLIDTSSCSGCKACQLACKDRHGLETGRLFRRVVEVEGGEWSRAGEAWETTVFAYSISAACMHCEQPACLAACPSGAISKDTDGVVVVAAESCLGCRYCEWACPYGAPQFSPATGLMTKCDLCADERAEGRPPSCVAACPLRALDAGPLEELRARHGLLAALGPLPDPATTRPSIVIVAPRPMGRRLAGEVSRIVNAEEILR